jgi:hypothetical protein
VRARLVVFFSIVVVSLVYLHVKGMNGPGYFPWEWQRLPALPSFTLIAAGLLPFCAGQYLYARAPRRTWLPVVSIATSTLALQIVCAGLYNPPFDLHRISDVVESPSATGYYTVAADLFAGSRTRPLRDWLPAYPALMASFPSHGQTKPPGPVLYYYAFINVFGSGTAAALAGGALVGLLAAAGVVCTFLLLDVLLENSAAAFHGASFFALCPGLLLFFPEFDQIYPIFTAAMLACWSLAMKRRSIAYAAAFGAAVGVAIFWSYSLLLLGLFLAAYTLAGPAADRATRLGSVAAYAAAAVVVVGASYAVLRLATGFDAVGTFRAAVANQARLLPPLRRPYPQTIFWDLFDFALGTGWISALLVLFWLLRSALGSGRERLIAFIALGQIAAVAIVGLLQTETARVWIFMMPLVMIPIGLELQQWTARSRFAVHACLALVVAAIHQNMLFLGIK